MKKGFVRGGLVGVLVLLAGCGVTVPPEGADDLAAWMEEVARPLKGRVKPLPAVQVVVPVAYQAEGLVDPFALSRFLPPPEPAAAQPVDPGAPAPDLARPREPLEAFALDDLKIQGVIEQVGRRWLIVAAPDGQLYRTGIGGYLGRDFGRIEAITEVRSDRGSAWQVVIRELVRDEEGRWRERVREWTVQSQS